MKRKAEKVIIATLGLETHWRGAVTIVDMLRGQGMKVIYIGNAFPDEIVRKAILEDVDVVGVSSLSGAHLALGGVLLQIARQKDIKDKMLFIIGGVFLPGDIPKLRAIGFDGVFGRGTKVEEICSLMQGWKGEAKKEEVKNGTGAV